MLAYAHPGQKAVEGTGNIRGHGTNLVDGQLVATVSGMVVRTNKLVSVRPVNSRYGGHVGDVVVGRVLEVHDSGWKVDINDKFHATLLVNSLFVPGSFALENGFLVTVPHILIRKMNTHFVTLASAEVNLIVGVNGNVWVSCDLPPQSSAEERHAALLRSVRVGNSVEVLKAASLEVHDRAIGEVYDRSLQLGLAPYAMLAEENATLLLGGGDEDAN